MAESILRPLTSDELKSTKDLIFSKPSERQRFQAQMTLFEKECGLKNIPFCRSCCKSFFEREQETIYKENDGGRFNSIDDVPVDIDFDSYTAKHFKKTAEKEWAEQQQVGTSKMRVILGTLHEYECKRGARVCVSVRDEKPIRLSELATKKQ